MAARRSVSSIVVTSVCRSLIRSFIRSSSQQWKRAVEIITVGTAAPTLYIAHIFLKLDHWSGELPALMEGGLIFKACDVLLAGAWGAACVGWAVLSCNCCWFARAEANSMGSLSDFHPQPLTGHVNSNVDMISGAK